MRILPLRLLLLVYSAAAARASPAQRELLADRAWWISRQLAPTPARSPSAADRDAFAVVEQLQPGATVAGYELVERTALLGVCSPPGAADSVAEREAATDGALELAGPSPVLGAQDAQDAAADDDDNAAESEAVCALPLPERTSNADTQVAQTLGGDELADGPTLEYQCLLEDTELVYVNANYRLRNKFDAGSHGEVWKATRRGAAAAGRDDERFVLKRLFLELGEQRVLMGLREAHFGRLLAAEPHVARFVEHFFRPSGSPDAATDAPPELWLAFFDEGTSLRHLLYAKREATHAGVIFEPSPFWRRLRADAHGEAVFREILRQLLQSVAAAEETREYQPPEVLFSDAGQPYDYAAPRAYDLWSVGVVFLEMLLGSPQVFRISARARAKLDAKLQGKDEPTRLKSYLLHVLSHEFCIFQPPPHQLRALWRAHAVAADGCSFGRFNVTVVARDPLRKGLVNPWGLDLLWKLLQWHPTQRISAARALEHAFFRGAYVCHASGRSFATRQELAVHEAYLAAQAARDSEMAFVVRERYALPSGFACPHCRRSFSTVAACEQHLRARKHGAAAGTSFCAFDALALERAVAAETAAYLAEHQHVSLADPRRVGAALFQGRKKYMEDFLVVSSNPQLGFELYAVSDGHLGTRAAAFAVDNLLPILSANLAASLAAGGAGAAAAAEREFAEREALRQTFLELHSGFLRLEGDGQQRDFSGCTLTVVLYFRAQRRLVSANVGDSRAIAIGAGGAAVQLTTDHWPNTPGERARVESSGGFVSFAGLWRVVGQLAVSRSLGDQHLRQYVSAEPSIVHAAVPEEDASSSGGSGSGSGSGSGGLLVVASDGVWETMANSDVARFAHERRLKADDDLSAMAQGLVVESYVRGSQDNLALILVAL
ncbi:hypothetical protein PybrP1_005511 [[Pythium] brassicae (nom. inval.)]|nr:hypothetical protein PybrP1_005511 [[Pythium] brassicae (nom. inval.)]